MKRLVVIFEKLLNLHLVKDVGQIPFLLGRSFDFDTTIVCNNNDTYSYLDSCVKGLKLHFIGLHSYAYLVNKSHEIDVLMLFHLRAKTIYQGIIYKIFNPHGFLYVKSDLKETEPPIIDSTRRNVLSQLYNRIIFKVFARIVDLVSFETMRVFSAIDSIAEHKKMYLPNGFDVSLPHELGVTVKAVSEKKDVILCVARHGAEQKNSELLLHAIQKIHDVGDWKLVFVGEYTAEFKATVDRFLLDHPQLSGKISMVGEVTDRKLLFRYYNDSKIFCMPSRWESWGIACTEALYFGCTIVVTRELSSAQDLTDDGRAGFLAGNENADEWSEVLRNLMSDPSLLVRYSQRGREHFDRNFSWPANLAPLAERLFPEGVRCSR
jgi:glycosyltransferase involved in cell wall biosynthesis